MNPFELQVSMMRKWEETLRQLQGLPQSISSEDLFILQDRARTLGRTTGRSAQSYLEEFVEDKRNEILRGE